MKEALPFTPEESHVIHYYRSRSATTEPWDILSHLSTAIGAMFFLGVYIFRGDLAWVFVSFALLLYRAFKIAFFNLRYTGLLKSIFDKYEVRLKEIAADKNASTDA